MNPFYEQIQAYLDGELTGEALQAFEEALSKDEALTTEVNVQKKMLEVLSDKNAYAFWQEVQHLEQQYRSPGQKKKAYAFPINRLLAMAATLVLLLAAVYYFRVNFRVPQTPDQLFTAYYAPGKQWEGDLSRGTSDDTAKVAFLCDSIVIAAQQRYATNDLPGAAEVLSQAIPLVGQEKCPTDFYYYLGLIALEQGSPAEAIVFLQQVKPTSLESDKAVWLTAFCYLKWSAIHPEHLPEARQAFETVAKGPYPENQKEIAKKILAELNKQ